MSEKFSNTPFSRRKFLAGTATAALASVVPYDSLLALTPKPKGKTKAATAKYHRLNLTDPAAAPMLASYEKGIRAMLQLAPDHPLNWYQNAITHLLDCPHGNWWFVVWHRGYLGWFEETIRKLSGDANFALPYWDWTALPRVPESFFQGLLNPKDPAYIGDYATFQSTYMQAVNNRYAAFSPLQNQQIGFRTGYKTAAEFWASAPPNFFPRDQARFLTAENPDFDEQTKEAVSLPTIEAALQPTTFIEFGSPKTAQHSTIQGFGILEGQPHNLVHNCVGGFMYEFLSPVDPIFFMHHANIDRLWDVWTHKQEALGLPTLPTGTDLPEWSNQPFAFFTNADGQPVSQQKAGDYATIGQFDYDYQPGSGSQVAVKAAGHKAKHPQSFKANVALPTLALAQRATSAAKVPAALIAAASKQGGPALIAKITIQPPEEVADLSFDVFVDAPEGTALTASSPYFAGSFAFFGSHHHHGTGPVYFEIPISNALRKLSAKKLLKSAGPLHVDVVPRARTPKVKALEATVKVLSVEVVSN